MQQLQQGVTLQNGKYAIVRVLGQGGFGITYLAEQTTLNRKVAIKEFFLNALCTRKDFSTVSITEEVEQAGLVERYMKKFIKEAQILSCFDNRWFSLLTFIIGLLINFASYATLFQFNGDMSQAQSVSIVGVIIYLVFFLPSIAVLLRRLHDTGHSGWCWLLGLIPIVGAIILLVWCCQDSDPMPNKYGPSPKYE